MSDSTENKKHKETAIVKCDNCGSNLFFDPATQELKCTHCGCLKSFDKIKVVNEIFIENGFIESERVDNESAVYKCDNCGAMVVLSANEVATFCPYCNTSHIVKTEDISGLKPNAVYPYTIVKDEALERFKKWAKKKLFAPRSFKKSLAVDKVHGVYEPAFTFDSSTYSTYVGRIGNRYTRIVGSGKNKRTETYIIWRSISGTLSRVFDDVFINASNDYEQKTLDKIMPFDYENIKGYSKEYLSGFMAKHHDKNMHDAWDDAKKVMDKTLRREILRQYSYDVVDYINVSTEHVNVTYKYVLLPIYQLNFKYKKKNYSVFVNGESAKITGKTPVSVLRVLTAIGIGVAVAILIALLALFLNS